MDECKPKRSRRPVRRTEEEPILCSTCGVPLILGDNWKQTSCGKGDYRCTTCRSKYQKDYYKNNKETLNKKRKEYYESNKETISAKQSDYKTKKNYGISKEEYNLLMEEGKCAICGSTEKLRLDHDHNTGKIRGVLCHWCNVGLGHFKDNLDLLIKAREYLSG